MTSGPTAITQELLSEGQGEGEGLEAQVPRDYDGQEETGVAPAGKRLPR